MKEEKHYWCALSRNTEYSPVLQSITGAAIFCNGSSTTWRSLWAYDILPLCWRHLPLCWRRPVKVMLSVVHGKRESSTKDGGSMGFFNSIILNPILWRAVGHMGTTSPFGWQLSVINQDYENNNRAWGILPTSRWPEVCGQHIQNDAFQAPEAHILVLLAPKENMGSLSHPVRTEAVQKSTEDGRKRHE